MVEVAGNGQGRRSGGRARKRQSLETDFPQKPFQQPKFLYPRVGIASEDEIEAIHLASLKVLKEIGIDVLLPEAKAIMAESGADVDPNSDRVRFDGDRKSVV